LVVFFHVEGHFALQYFIVIVEAAHAAVVRPVGGSEFIIEEELGRVLGHQAAVSLDN
jgi:hypothetical protein